MTRAQRARVAALAIAPVTVAGIALIRCGRSQAAWAIEIATAIAFSLMDCEQQITLAAKSQFPITGLQYYGSPNHKNVRASVATETTMSADSTMIF